MQHIFLSYEVNTHKKKERKNPLDISVNLFLPLKGQNVYCQRLPISVWHRPVQHGEQNPKSFLSCPWILDPSVLLGIDRMHFSSQYGRFHLDCSIVMVSVMIG